MKREKNKIVLNIPHCSTNGIFDKNIGCWPCNQFFVNDCVNKWTDWFVDFLFGGLSRRDNVETVVFPYSRFVCDAERLKNDPLDKNGNGIIYNRFDGYERRTLTDEQITRIMGIWSKHQEKLANAMMDENTILVDCHSFPSDVSDCNICIGHNEDWSYDKRIVDGVVRIFKNSGYTVEINKPYSNSIAPPKDFHYKSIMIEVNKRIYMNERTLQLEKSPLKWMRWDGVLQNVHDFLVHSEL